MVVRCYSILLRNIMYFYPMYTLVLNKVWKNVESWMEDIRFWIVVFFSIRLFGITNPPLEIAHSWRQGLTSMIARNFYQSHVDLLRPVIDMAGEKSGIIGSEFPFFNWLIYLFSLPFGYDHWYGRLINLAVCSVGLYFFYRLLHGIFTSRIAFHATILLTVSIWFSFSRKIMPDTFSISLIIIGLHCCYIYLTKNKSWQLLLGFIFITLGLLCKIPALCLLTIAVIIPFLPTLSTLKKTYILVMLTISVSIAFTWYFHWVPYLLTTYEFQLYFPKTLLEGWYEILPEWKGLLEKFYFSAFHSYFAFLTFIIGMFFILRQPCIYTRIALIAVSVVFSLFILKTGAVFPTHSYYIVPFVPIMAVIAGCATAQLPKKWGYLALLTISIEAISNQQHDFFIKPELTYPLNAEILVEKSVPSNSRVIFNGGPSPHHLYFINRKGWNLTPEKINTQTIDSLKNLGAQFLILDKHKNSNFTTQHSLIGENEDYEIYNLD
jgi:hypothetical protein